MNVFQFEVKRLIKSCITWSVVCGILIILFMSFYPSMKDSGIQELVETKLNAFPEGMMQAFGLDEMVDFYIQYGKGYYKYIYGYGFCRIYIFVNHQRLVVNVGMLNLNYHYQKELMYVNVVEL